RGGPDKYCSAGFVQINAGMTVKLDFEECLKDSPRFRAEIEVVQTDVSELETRLEKVRLLSTYTQLSDVSGQVPFK
ncbi:hypothetical protein XENORESO_007649, partial [Xenotaenia resolanae]